MGTSYPIFPVLPQFQLNRVLIEKLVLGSNQNQKLNGASQNKDRLNSIYVKSKECLHESLRRRDSVAWIRRAYDQLVLWALIYKTVDKTDDDLFCIKHLSPMARYGWRYIIELSLGSLDPDQRVTLGQPTDSETADVLTVLCVMYMTSEVSNTLHYFQSWIEPVTITYSMQSEFGLDVNFSDLANKRIEEMHVYVSKVTSFDRFPRLNPGPQDDSVLLSMINRFLADDFGFTLTQACTLLGFFQENFFNPETGVLIGSILHSEEYVQRWISDETGLEVRTVKRIFDFSLLNQSKIQSTSREFLKKSQTQRMINYAGVRLPRIREPHLLYYDNKLTSILASANYHILISPLQFAEWIDTLFSRLLYGLRPDLKERSQQTRKRLESVERIFKKDIFEDEVLKNMRDHGLFAIDKVEKYMDGKKSHLLPCGEIDILGYQEQERTLFVIECKCLAAATDSKMIAGDVDNLSNQREYHSQVMKKISWVTNNMNWVAMEFQRRVGRVITSPKEVRAILVTLHPNAMKYFQTDFEVMMIDEFVDMLAVLCPKDSAQTP